MCLVNNERGVLAQQLIVLNFGEQNTVGHEFNGAVLAHLRGETHLVTHGLTNFLPQFFGDALRHRTRGKAARLGVPNHAFFSKTEFQAHLGQLRGLTRAGLASDNDDLVITNGRLNVFATLADGQLFGIGNHSGNQRVIGALFGPVPVVLAALMFVWVFGA